jgi:hypothetical protein
MKYLSRWAVLWLAGIGAVSGCMPSSDLDELKNSQAAAYSGLANQKCAVMVWADLRTQTEYSSVRLDLAKLMVARLEKPADPLNRDPERRPGTEFLLAASVVKFQRDYPQVEFQPITDVAPLLQVARLVYIEIESLSAQSAVSIMLLKGEAKATLKVLEIADGKAHIAYEESGISVTYPPGAPEGVVPSDTITVRTVYEGTLRALADALAARLG